MVVEWRWWWGCWCGSRWRWSTATGWSTQCATSIDAIWRFRSPDPNSAVIGTRSEHRRIHRIPADAIHSSCVSSESRQRFLTSYVPNIHGIVFASAGDETFVDATKARVNCVISLHDALEDSHEALVTQIPQVKALRRHIQQRQPVRWVHRERHDWIVLLDHVEIVARLEAIIANAIMCVSAEDGLIVAEKGEGIDPNTIPIVEYCTVQVAQVKLPTNSARHKASSIWRECSTRQRLLVWMRHLRVQLHLNDVENQQLWWLFGAADNEILWVRRPRDKRDTIGMALKGFQLFQLVTFRINFPNDAESILGTGGEFETIWGEFAVPDFVLMLVEYLESAKVSWNVPEVYKFSTFLPAPDAPETRWHCWSSCDRWEAKHYRRSSPRPCRDVCNARFEVQQLVATACEGGAVGAWHWRAKTTAAGPSTAYAIWYFFPPNQRVHTTLRCSCTSCSSTAGAHAVCCAAVASTHCAGRAGRQLVASHRDIQGTFAPAAGTSSRWDWCAWMWAWSRLPRRLTVVPEDRSRLCANLHSARVPGTLWPPDVLDCSLIPASAPQQCGRVR